MSTNALRYLLVSTASAALLVSTMAPAQTAAPAADSAAATTAAPPGAPPPAGVQAGGQPGPAGTDPAAPVAGGGGDGTGEIIVTGSVFKRANTATPSPVTVLSAETLQLRGISTITNAIQSLSSNGAGNLTNAFSANGAFASGASAPSLRGLTTDSTLVLFDGLRGSYYPLADDGARNFVDTNTIPEAIVDRVEVLKDGASSTYGADAVAGVVNIILKKQIQGFNGLVEAGVSRHGDAGQQRVSATYGYGDLASQGFNVYANFEYQHNAALYNRDRGFPYNTGDLRGITGLDADGNVVHATNINPNGLDSTGAYQGLGSTIVPYARRLLPDGTQADGRLVNAAAGCRGLTPHVVGDQGAGDLGTVCEQDLIRDYYLIEPRQERLGGTLHATVNVGDNAQAYAVFTYYQNDTLTTGTPQNARQTAFTGNFTSTSLPVPALLPDGTLNPNNPFAAEGSPAVLYYRFGDIPQSTEQLSKTYRGAAGINGTFGDGWGYTLDATGMNSVLKNTFKGYIYAQGLVDAVSNGTYNFVDPTLNSAAVRDAIAPTAVQNAKSELYQVQGTITKKLLDLPGGPLQIAIGGAGRYEKVTDPSANPGAVDPLNPNPTQQYLNLNPFFSGGHRYVESGFFEINAPIVKPLEVNVSGRYDHYSTGFSNFSPKVGAKFQPVKQVALRGTFSKGFRVPSFAETNSTTIGFINVTPPANFQAEHQRPGGGPNAYASAYLVGLDTVGNPDLKPEKATNYTLGLILEPTSSFSFTADYYHIKKTRVISAASYNGAFDAYFAGDPIPAGYTIVQDAADPDYPNATRRILLIQSPYVNASSLVTSGIDLQATASVAITDDLKLISSGEATYVIKLDQKYPGEATQHYAGTLGPYAITSASGTPRWRAQWQNTLVYKNYSLTGTAYYTSGYKESAEDVTGGGTRGDCLGNAAAAGVPTVYEDGATPIRCSVKRFIDVDLHAALKATDKFTFYVDVQNVFDARAPFDPTTYGAYQYNSSWSEAGIIGRYFKAGATFSF